MPAKISLLKLTQGKTIKAMYEKYQCIQDLLVPLSTLSDSLEYFHKEFQVQLLLLWFVVLLRCAWQLIKAATVLSSLRTCHIVFLHLLHISFEISTFNFHYTHTRLTALFPGLPGWAGTRTVKPVWILLKQETLSGSGIHWAICKSAPRSRQITMPPAHHSVFYRPDALPATQPTVSKHRRHFLISIKGP